MSVVKEKLTVKFEDHFDEPWLLGSRFEVFGESPIPWGSIHCRLIDREGGREFLASNWWTHPEAPPEVAAMLFQAVLTKAKEMGYDSVIGDVAVDGLTARFLNFGRTEVVGYIIRVKVNGKTHGRLPE